MKKILTDEGKHIIKAVAVDQPTLKVEYKVIRQKKEDHV